MRMQSTFEKKFLFFSCMDDWISHALRRWKYQKLTGTHRVVHCIGQFAIKRPVLFSWKLFLCGLLANMQEAMFSKTGWPELCPVIFTFPGGWFNIMNRALPLTDEQFLNFDYSEWVERNDYTIPVENKKCSFGFLNGEIVAVDYGS